jgi:hypothetical protein
VLHRALSNIKSLLLSGLFWLSWKRWWWTFGFYKTREISCLAEEGLPFQEGLSRME